MNYDINIDLSFLYLKENQEMPQYRSQPTILTGMAVDQQLQIMK